MTQVLARNVVKAQVVALRDRSRRCVAYYRQSETAASICDTHGTILAVVDDGALYDKFGTHLGWIWNGEVFNLNCELVLSAAEALAQEPAACPESESLEMSRQNNRRTQQTRPTNRRSFRSTWAPKCGLAHFQLSS